MTETKNAYKAHVLHTVGDLRVMHVFRHGYK